MCAITGIYAYSSSAPNPNKRELRAMRDHMAVRGPDGKGEWYSKDQRIIFGHRRLAIIDLSDRAAQPMRSADGCYVITFNGEIYNYRALRQQLEAEGCLFYTQSDTEVLLQLYAREGADMVRRLRGMFALAIWDEKKQSLLLARDAYGIKPLYYSDDGCTLRFASQVKALLAGGGISREPEPAGLAGFYLFGSVPEPWTLYRDVYALPAGHILQVNSQGVQIPKPWFSLSETWRCAEEQRLSAGEAELRKITREALLDSVRLHLVADVPVGAFLSAGVDSSALVGLMKEVGQQDIQTVTLAFDEFKGSRDDEVPLATNVARYYGVHHTVRRVTETEFQQDLPKIMQAMDQPSIDGINTWFVSKAAKELGLKVAISGLGGDELFGGYSSFQELPRWVNQLARLDRIPYACSTLSLAMDILYRTSLRHLKVINDRPKLRGFFRYGTVYPGAYLLRRAIYLPEELATLDNHSMLQQGLEKLNPLQWIESALHPVPHTSFGKVAAMEACLYMRNQLLRDTDWASMAHSLEVRVPLVDVELLRSIAPLMVNQRDFSGKRLLSEAPNPKLPHEVTHRPKTGFSTPIARWLLRSEIWMDRQKTTKWEEIGGLWARTWVGWVAREASP